MHWQYLPNELVWLESFDQYPLHSKLILSLFCPRKNDPNQTTRDHTRFRLNSMKVELKNWGLCDFAANFMILQTSPNNATFRCSLNSCVPLFENYAWHSLSKKKSKDKNYPNRISSLRTKSWEQGFFKGIVPVHLQALAHPNHGKWWNQGRKNTAHICVCSQQHSPPSRYRSSKIHVSSMGRIWFGCPE